MSSENSADTIKENFTIMMGEALGPVYYKLYNQVIFLHQRWDAYLELFATEKSRIDLLNKSGSFIFYIIQKGLFENVIMSINRITDSPISSGQRNLTIQVLPSLISNVELKKEIELQIIWHIKPTIQFAKELRNKRFGHEDFDISMGISLLQEQTGIEQVEMALKAIRNLMNSIQREYEGGTTIYKNRGSITSAISLLRTIQDGQNSQDYLDYLRLKGQEPDDIFKRSIISFEIRHTKID